MNSSASFVARCRFPGQQAFGYLGTPFLGVITGLERPSIADRVAIARTDGKRAPPQPAPRWWLANLGANERRFLAVVTVLVFLADLI